jgi:hypothetical protein
MKDKVEYHKKCITCNKDFIAYNNKALYCPDNRSCENKAMKSKKLVQGQTTLIHALENSMVMQMLYYLIEQNSIILGVPIPSHLIPKHKLQFSDHSQALKEFIKIEERRHEKIIDKVNKNLETQKEAKPKVRKSVIDKFRDLQEERKRVIDINIDEATAAIKKSAIQSIKRNTGIFPILTPQDTYKIGGIIEKIKQILTDKDGDDINTDSIVDYFSGNTFDIKNMIDETYFE